MKRTNCRSQTCYIYSCLALALSCHVLFFSSFEVIKWSLDLVNDIVQPVLPTGSLFVHTYTEDTCCTDLFIENLFVCCKIKHLELLNLCGLNPCQTIKLKGDE